MKKRWIATLLMLALALAALLPAAAVAEPAVLTMTLGVKEKFQINTAAISGAEGKQLVYATSNKKVVDVSADGVIIAKKKGIAKIAVGYDDVALAVCTVTVQGAPKKIAFTEKNLVLSVGGSQQLFVTLPKKTASTITYESSDTAVATVDSAGKVTAVAGGHAVITAKTFNGKSATCPVVVLTGVAPTELKLDTQILSLQQKETFQLKPTVNEGADTVYAYTTANKKIATVDAEGVVTAKKKGATQITVTTHNGLSATVNVVVKGKLKDVYGALTNSPKTFLKYAKKLKMKRDTTTGDTTSVMYYNNQVALIMTANSCQVSLNPTTSPKYSLQNIDCSMSATQAAAKLVANGWALADAKTVDGIDVRAFTKGGDATHPVTISADGDDIRSIDAFWTW